MTRMLPRTNLHSSKLIRCLADLSIADVVDPGNAFAEKLGQWIHFADAITLSAVHNDKVESPHAGKARSQCASSSAIHVEFVHIRSVMVNSIMKTCSPRPGTAFMQLPAPQPTLPMDFSAAYAPYRRFYEVHQRDMDLSVQPLRIRVREAVAKASPTLKKLADLDATLERILRDRESKLLARVPVLLRKRFEQLFIEHQQKLAEVQMPDKPADWTQAGGWLARFCNDMQMLLLAEADLRLQPAIGLMEALKKETQ